MLTLCAREHEPECWLRVYERDVQGSGIPADVLAAAEPLYDGTRWLALNLADESSDDDVPSDDGSLPVLIDNGEPTGLTARALTSEQVGTLFRLYRVGEYRSWLGVLDDARAYLESPDDWYSCAGGCSRLVYMDDANTCSTRYDTYTYCDSCYDDHYSCDYCDECTTCSGCSCREREEEYGGLDDWNARPPAGWMAPVPETDGNRHYTSAGAGWRWMAPIGREHVTRDNAHRAARFGIELEWEVGRQSRQSLRGIVNEFRQAIAEQGMADYVVLKSDGSLSNGGELVMPPAPLEWWHEHGHKRLDAILSAGYAAGARSDGWNTTGMHVHVSRAWTSELHAARALLCLTRGQRWWERVAGRPSGQYNDWTHLFWASRRSVWDSSLQRERAQEGLREKVKSALNSELSRYSAVTFTTPHVTSEFRLFRGTVHAERAMRRLESVAALVEWSHRVARRNTFAAGLDGTASLVEFILGNANAYPFLAQWLNTGEGTNATIVAEQEV